MDIQRRCRFARKEQTNGNKASPPPYTEAADGSKAEISTDSTSVSEPIISYSAVVVYDVMKKEQMQTRTDLRAK